MNRSPALASVVLATACLSLPVAASSQEASAFGTARETEPIVIGERFTIHSEILGEDRTLLVSTPDGYDTSTDAYPVLYLLDGDAHFHHATGVVDFLADNGRMPRVIVVAVPNPSQSARTRDLTPEHRSATAFGQPADSMFPTAGGAGTFLRFLRDELAPIVESEYRTAPFSILVGHSFGGLFNVHALLSDRSAFRAHIAISPSLWWDERRMVDEADAFFDGLAAGTDSAGAGGPASASSGGSPISDDGPTTFVYMTMGNEGGAMLRGAWELSGVFEEKAPEWLEWEFTLMDAEDHGSVPHRSLYDGLEWLYRDWALAPFSTVAWEDDERLERIDEHFAAVSERYGYDLPTPEAFLNNVGYALLGSGRPESAIGVFETNVERYPDSPNVYDSLGDAYDAADRLDDAIASYEEAVRRAETVEHPNLEVYRGKLAEAREKRDSPNGVDDRP